MVAIQPSNQKQAIIPIPFGYRETIVTPKASRSVEAFWSFTAEAPGQSLVLPDGRCDVILRHNINSDGRQIPIVTGPATQSYMVEYQAGDSWLGIRLRPRNGVMLWGSHIGEATDAVLRGQDAINLIPALKSVQISTLTLTELAAVLKVLSPPRPDARLDQAVDALHASGGRITIARLAQIAGCTARHLNRLFRSHVGLGTKTYAQLVQFHRTLNLLQRERLAIADAAFEGGYADHAHLSRACRRFGGFTPARMPQELSLPALFA